MAEEVVMASSEMPHASAVLMDARDAVQVPPSMVSLVPAPSAPPMMNSTVETARRRVRGPTVSERRAEEQRVEQQSVRATSRARSHPKPHSPQAVAVTMEQPN